MLIRLFVRKLCFIKSNKTQTTVNTKKRQMTKLKK